MLNILLVDMVGSIWKAVSHVLTCNTLINTTLSHQASEPLSCHAFVVGGAGKRGAEKRWVPAKQGCGRGKSTCKVVGAGPWVVARATL